MVKWKLNRNGQCTQLQLTRVTGIAQFKLKWI